MTDRGMAPRPTSRSPRENSTLRRYREAVAEPRNALADMVEAPAVQLLAYSSADRDSNLEESRVSHAHA